MSAELEQRIAALEADNAALRSALSQALALVRRSGFNWKDALRLVERWASAGSGTSRALPPSLR